MLVYMLVYQHIERYNFLDQVQYEILGSRIADIFVYLLK